MRNSGRANLESFQCVYLCIAFKELDPFRSSRPRPNRGNSLEAQFLKLVLAALRYNALALLA